jgi:hypothetical protein
VTIGQERPPRVVAPAFAHEHQRPNGGQRNCSSHEAVTDPTWPQQALGNSTHHRHADPPRPASTPRHGSPRPRWPALLCAESSHQRAIAFTSRPASELATASATMGWPRSRGGSTIGSPREESRRTAGFLDLRRYEALARPRRWREAVLMSSSSAARSAIRSSSVISRHTVDRREPDRRTCPAASSSPSSLSVRL